MSEQDRSSPDAKAKLVPAWAGATLTVIAIIGFLAAPGARILWIVLLVFGVATIPQVLLWRHSTPRRPETARRQKR